MPRENSPFQRKSNIYENRSVLRKDYQPKTLVQREEEIQQYADHLDFVFDGWGPANIFVYGKSGTGKTATTNHILNHLEKDIEEDKPVRADGEPIDLSIVKINCDGRNSSYRVATAIVNKLRDPKDMITQQGYSTQAVYDMMYEELNKLGNVIIIVLDEIDHISTDNSVDDSILYQLTRCESIGYLDDAALSVIGISNDFSFRNSLSSKVQETLTEKELVFPAYEADELREILSQRAEIALQDDVYSRGTIAKCAALAARDKGNARQALDILKNAADLARSESADRITEEHIDEGKINAERGDVDQMIGSLSPHGKLVVMAIANLQKSNDTPATTREIFDRYCELYLQISGESEDEANPLTIRSVRDHLSELNMIGMTNNQKRNLGRKSGISRYHSLDVDEDAVISYFQSNEVGTLQL